MYTSQQISKALCACSYEMTDYIHRPTTRFGKKKEKRVIQTGNAKIHPYRAHSTDLSRSSSLRSTRASRIANISAVDRTGRAGEIVGWTWNLCDPAPPTPDHAGTMRHQPGHRKLRVLGWCGARHPVSGGKLRPAHTPSCRLLVRGIHRFPVIGGSDRFGGGGVVTRRSPCDAGATVPPPPPAAPDRGSQRAEKKEWTWPKRDMRARIFVE